VIAINGKTKAIIKIILIIYYSATLNLFKNYP